MKILRQLTAVAMLLVAVALQGQTREYTLTLNVTAATGESLEGTTFSLKQTDYSMSYSVSETKLNASGTCIIKVYGGNHELIIKKDGLNTYEEAFNVAGDATKNITLTEAVREPFSLDATVIHDAYTGRDDALLTWNKEKPAFFDDFESYTDWSIQFGEWTGIDGDRQAAAALLGSYMNRGTLQYAQIINPMTVDPTWWYEYEVLRPYSGRQYVGFTRTETGDANDDWLISPAITVGVDNVVRFMAKAADKYRERFEVGITLVDEPTSKDFTILSSGNYETVSYEQWVPRVYDLSAYSGKTVKIGIHYIGEANRGGAFMLMVDDFYVGQPESTETASLSRRGRLLTATASQPTFVAYLDGVEAGRTPECSYTFGNLSDGTHTLGVKAVYQTTETSIVTTTIDVDKSSSIPVTINVTTNNSASADGISVDLTNKATSEEYRATVVDGVASIASLPKGDYLLNVAAEAYETVERDIVVSGESYSTEVGLIERLITPYNLTADVTANAESPELIDVLLSWNQDLGFVDSFETYEDFSTKFGDWTTYDLDQMPVYPIGLGSADNIVSFPGSGTATQPKPAAPMVFNPKTTVPSMAGDQAILAPTGDKTVIFFSPQRAAADKWLISPAQVIREGYEWHVTAKAYSTYPEKVEFCISESPEPANFTVLGQIQLPEGYWQTYSLDLAAYAGKTVYLGIHYISYDAFLAQVDDFYVGPGEDGASGFVGDVEHYNITLDGNNVESTQLTNYTFKALSNVNHVFGVAAHYVSGTSETAFYNYQAQGGVANLERMGITVAGKKGAIAVATDSLKTVEVYGATGIRYVSTAVDGRVEMALPAGLYLVRVGQASAKVIVR